MTRTELTTFRSTPEFERDVEVIYEHLKRQGFELSRQGKPNVTQIVLYAVKQVADQLEKQAQNKKAG